jgi:hypothetical protein
MTNPIKNDKSIGDPLRPTSPWAQGGLIACKKDRASLQRGDVPSKISLNNGTSMDEQLLRASPTRVVSLSIQKVQLTTLVTVFFTTHSNRHSIL